MKKLSFLVLALLILIPSLASAKIGSRNLNEERKQYRQCFKIAVPVAGTDTTTGTAGLLNTIYLDDGEMSVSNTQIPTMPWPAKVGLIIDDDSAGTAVSCATVVVRGFTQHGGLVSETVTNVGETESTTTNVFATVISVDVNTCTNNAVNDHMVVYASLNVGTGVDIKSTKDVESACIEDASDSNQVKCAAQDNGSANDLSSKVDISANSINIGATIFGDTLGTEVAAADLDNFCISVRPSHK